MLTTGKVYLVGAGPGHAELLTIKAANLLKSGDVIIYDRLIQQEVLALVKPSAERIYMGKPLGHHDSRQDEIHELLVRKAREGKMVVRLKGGDPFLFGRGGEEAEYLAEHGIPFEVIPGVCSALSAPLSAGIAVTHRDYASAVTIVTGHECNRPSDSIDYNALSSIGGTLVFLMGVHNVAQISAKLIAAGRDRQTPAALIQMAFWHDEKVVTGTLGTIADVAREAGIKPPATFVVGEAVRLREKLKHADRDLARNPSFTDSFAPAPSPHELFRLASAGIGAQVLAWAIEHRIFDRLEEALPVCDLAPMLGAREDALEEVLQALVSLGLLEARPEGYRNLELASRYLRHASVHTLENALWYQSTRTVNSSIVERFVFGSGKTLSHDNDEFRSCAACEEAARLAAPEVVEQLELTKAREVLLAGWGTACYARELQHRWPLLKITSCNPVAGDDIPDKQFDVILVSGLLRGASPKKGDELLTSLVNRVNENGVLLLQDDLLSAGISEPPEVALARLAVRATNGEQGGWTTDRLLAVLDRLGFHGRTQSLAAAGVLVTAISTRKTQRLQRAAAACVAAD